MAWLEAAKQENFAPETLQVWFTLMSRQGWTATKFRQRVLAVLHAHQYGKITFDDFVNAEAVPQTVSGPRRILTYECIQHPGKPLKENEVCPECFSELERELNGE